MARFESRNHVLIGFGWIEISNSHGYGILSFASPIQFSAIDNPAFPIQGAFDEKRGSRNLVGISIQHSDSEEEELFVYDSMQICPEEFDFGIE